MKIEGKQLEISSIIIDLIPLSWMVLVFAKAKLIMPISSFNTNNYLSLENSKCYRGIFAMAVLFHHIAQETENGIFLHFFTRVGYLAVAIFFFLSGYGLQKSYISKSNTYKNNFLLKRLPSIIIPYIIITLFYWLIYYCNGQVYSIVDFFKSIINGYPLTLYSWYIIYIIVFYFVFWVLMMICKKHFCLMIIGGITWNVLYIFFCRRMDYGEWWYNSSHLLIIGMFWATYEQKILKIIKKIYLLLMPLVWLSFIIAFQYKNKIARLMRIPKEFVAMFVAALFVMGVIMIILKLQIGNRLLCLLGAISLEIYISQGLFVEIFRSKYLFIENEILWCISVIVCTITFSFFIHNFFKFILNKFRVIAL